MIKGNNIMTRIAVFSSKKYDEIYLNKFVDEQQSLTFFEGKLDKNNVALTLGFDVVCCFVNDDLCQATIEQLSQHGIKLIAMRCAGYNNVDIAVAKRLGIAVCRVAKYSPHAVAEHALALILGLNRHTHRAFNRVRENDYSLDGLLGFDLFNKTVGVIGTGTIGATFASKMKGIGCNVIAYDPQPNAALIQQDITYVDINNIFTQSDIISLHCPLLPETFHLINQKNMAKMKKGVMLINTSRGALINTTELIQYLKSGHIGYVGLDVYEEEADLFFEDQSNDLLQDDVFARLLTFPNVLITGHQAFFTKEALDAIGSITMENIRQFTNSNLSAVELL